MALTKCGECGNEVSTTAATCPKCGARVKPKSNVWKWVLGVPVGAFALIMVIGANVKGDPEKDQARAVIGVCMKDMNDQLRSAGFRDAARAVCERFRDDFRAKYRMEP